MASMEWRWPIETSGAFGNWVTSMGCQMWQDSRASQERPVFGQCPSFPCAEGQSRIIFGNIDGRWELSALKGNRMRKP